MDHFLIGLLVYWLLALAMFGTLLYFNYKEKLGANGAIVAAVAAIWPAWILYYVYDLIRRRFAPVA